MKQNMFRGNTQSNIVKMVVILALLLFNIRPLEAARHLDVKMSKLGTRKVSISHYWALPPSSNPCTYIPSWIHVDMPCSRGRGSTRVHQQFFFFFQCSPIRSEMVWNRTWYGSDSVWNGPKLNPIWAKILIDLKKKVNFKFIFYLDLVSNFRYCILI